MSGAAGKAFALIVAIFVLGMIAGASLFYVGQRSVGPRGPERPPADDRRGPPPGPLGDMTRRLDLTDDQQGQIREILDRYREEMDGMLEQSRVEIRDVLTEEQRAEFDTLRPARPGGHGPPGGGRHKGPPPPRDGRRKRPPPPPPGR